MNATSRKKMDEIVRACEPARNVLLLGCSGCPVGMETGGIDALNETADALRNAGKSITGSIMIEMLCNKALVGIRLGRNVELVKTADTIVVYSCGVGVQAVANMTMKPVAPGLNTISLGGMQGLWPSSERCGQCGDCLLAYTGGICPITMCSKSLVNGTCGGTDNGKCEVSPEKDCGWYLIYERLKNLGRLDDLKRMNAPRNHKLQDIPENRRATMSWAIEADRRDPWPPKKKKKKKKKSAKKPADGAAEKKESQP